jgi:hypothetical protein
VSIALALPLGLPSIPIWPPGCQSFLTTPKFYPHPQPSANRPRRESVCGYKELLANVSGVMATGCSTSREREGLNFTYFPTLLALTLKKGFSSRSIFEMSVKRGFRVVFPENGGFDVNIGVSRGES